MPNVTTIVTTTGGTCAVTIDPSETSSLPTVTVTITVPGETITVDPIHPPDPTETQTIIVPSSCTKAPAGATPPPYGSSASSRPASSSRSAFSQLPASSRSTGQIKTFPTSYSPLFPTTESAITEGPVPSTIMPSSTIPALSTDISPISTVLNSGPTGPGPINPTANAGHQSSGEIHGVTITATKKTLVYVTPAQVTLNFGPINPSIQGVPAHDGQASNPGVGSGQGPELSPIGPQSAGIVNSVPVSMIDGGKVVIGGTTFDGLAPTTNVQTIGGQTFSILPSGHGVVAPGGMVIVASTAAMTAAPSAPSFNAMTIGSIGLDIGTDLGIVGGHTFHVGPGAPETAITIGSDTIRAGPGGLMFASTTIAPLAPLITTTIDGIAFTIGPDFVVMSGQTYSFASPTAVDMGTETVSIGTDGIILPSTTISRPPKATGDSDEHNSANEMEVTRWSIILTIFTGIIAVL